ncbi:MAG TPA: hypothetical protein VJ912_03765 [Candidatus Nanoarchaeia archaeon]|nr:hypothetical protein [Candidatus Nanoarchaeia archaeon]
MPMFLSWMSPEHINEMYKRAKFNEGVFRNILVDISDDSKEADFLNLKV